MGLGFASDLEIIELRTAILFFHGVKRQKSKEQFV